MKGLSVVLPHENYRGLSYGLWATRWWNWLLSDEPDNYKGDMLFLRGNVAYGPVGGVEGAPRHVNPRAFFDRRGKLGETIFEGTPIFFPVVNTLVRIGDMYDGRLIETETDARLAAIKDIEEGGAMWATIKKIGEKKATKLVRNLADYLFESIQFDLRVSSDSPLRNRMENSFDSGSFTSVTAGYYLLIRFLPSSTYRIHFGGRGRGVYHTDAFYDITVQGRKRIPLDKSGYIDARSIA